jgi:hypothetical protein
VEAAGGGSVEGVVDEDVGGRAHGVQRHVDRPTELVLSLLPRTLEKCVGVSRETWGKL